ncbi:caveolin-2-like [Arapaima gigas]
MGEMTQDAGKFQTLGGHQTTETEQESLCAASTRGGSTDLKDDGSPPSENSGVSLNNRDPREVNKNLKVTFENVIAEPQSMCSFDRVWIWSHASFEVSSLWLYRTLSLPLAVPVSLITVLLFTLLSFLHIWKIVPCVQLLLVSLRWVQTT